MSMKMSEAMSAYRSYGQELVQEKNRLTNLCNNAKKKAEITGVKEDYEQAATLELSIEGMNKRIDENNEALGGLIEQWSLIANAESVKQQSEAVEEESIEMAKIMEVARRISKGDHVPFSDEKKLMEYSSDLYQTAKAAGMLRRAKEYKEYESLWDEEKKEPEQAEDPIEVANNTEVDVQVPDSSLEITNKTL